MKFALFSLAIFFSAHLHAIPNSQLREGSFTYIPIDSRQPIREELLSAASTMDGCELPARFSRNMSNILRVTSGSCNNLAVAVNRYNPRIHNGSGTFGVTSSGGAFQVPTLQLIGRRIILDGQTFTLGVDAFITCVTP